MSDAGKAKLTEYGIAPPTGRRAVGGPVLLSLTIRCPLCGSPDTDRAEPVRVHLLQVALAVQQLP